MDYILDPLNDKQREGVTTTEGSVLVIAGAGSGKTRLITHRFAYLMREKRLDMGAILAVTFTNKAASEMKERIGGLVGRDASQAWVRTFHSMGAMILRRNPAPVGLDKNFVIYDDGDSKNLVKSIIRDMNLKEETYKPGNIAHTISRLKDDLVTPDDYRGQGEEYDNNIRDIYAAYEKSLRKNNAADFPDLILLTLKLFRENPEVLKKYQNLWQYAMVDEFQDTNKAQYELIQTIVSHNKNICVVGDDDQSIYSWRGANVENIFDFKERYQPQIILLEQNYRSTSNILDAANEVVNAISTRMEKKLWTSRDGGEKIRVVEQESDKYEADFVAGEIDKLLAKYRLSDFAVFYRTNAQSRALEEAFIRKHIDYRIFGGQKFYERMEVKDIMGYVRLAINPYDRGSFERIINVPKRGIGDAARGKLIEFTENNGISYIETLLKADEIPGTTHAVSGKCRDLGQVLYELNQGADKIPPTTFLTVLIDAVGYRSYIRGYDEAWEERTQNVEELVNSVKEYETQNAGANMIDFANDVTLRTDLDSMQDDDEGKRGRDYVSLMTIHTAKGLEFPVVFTTGVAEGLIPHFSARMDPREEDEELRIFYVAMTRAKDLLYLTYPRTRLVYGERRDSHGSEYLALLPQELVELKIGRAMPAAQKGGYRKLDYPRTASAGKKTAPRDFEPAAFEVPANGYEDFDDDEPIVVGQKVYHRMMGKGVVLFVSPNIVKIDFEYYKSQVFGGNYRMSLQKIKE